jgi:hypothetical protein
MTERDLPESSLLQTPSQRRGKSSQPRERLQSKFDRQRGEPWLLFIRLLSNGKAPQLGIVYPFAARVVRIHEMQSVKPSFNSNIVGNLDQGFNLAIMSVLFLSRLMRYSYLTTV